MTTQLKEMQQENKQLLNMIQQIEDHSMSRTPSCSTISMVNLQYKYEELLANYNGLLKILEMRVSDVRKYQEDNARLKQEMESVKVHLQNYEEEISRLSEKLENVKSKKNDKIIKLKKERDTLLLVHNQLIDLLHKQCMEKDEVLHKRIKRIYRSRSSFAATRSIIYLLQYAQDDFFGISMSKVRKNNILTYENFQYQQEIEYLRSLLPVKRYKSDENSVSSEIKISKRY
ncbi:hypothetical protein NQ318_011970 [Aromia moschata]|uniref:Uncharacterized protein n=1 Tax=Aromia moschata TaxID=1265417 RepID=A0AAV8XZP2_9CUCU|nr:hypothetical protein NQ318_011970 [Aromia moschata]